MEIRIVDVTDATGFGLVPPCADPGFDHRSCDYWEDADNGSKAARLSWLEPAKATPAQPRRPDPSSNPFLADLEQRGGLNPFSTGGGSGGNPFAVADEEAPENPFAPATRRRPSVGDDAPRKLRLLGRGIGVFGSYAKVLLADDTPSVYAQFGPLTAYPRAHRVRELYPQLPDAPLPAVITCIASTREARGQGHALRLVAAVCDDLAERGFTAVEAYPTLGALPDATSAATPAFWGRAGFDLAVADERFPVMRRELA